MDVNTTLNQLIGLGGLGLAYFTLYHSYLAPKRDAKIKLALKLANIGSELKALLTIFEHKTKSGEEFFQFFLDENLPPKWQFTTDEEVILVNLGEYDKAKKVNFLVIPWRLNYFLNCREFQPPPLSPGVYPFGPLWVRKESYGNFIGQLKAALELIEAAAKKLSGNKMSIL